MKKIILLLASLFALATGVQSQELPLIPYPQSVKVQKGELTIPKVITHNSTEFADYLSKEFQTMDLTSQLEKDAKKAFVSFNFNSKLKSEGEYTLTIGKKDINIEAASGTGFLYAIQTLKQLVENRPADNSIKQLEIKDKPAYSWRAMHFDASRHFQDKEVVKGLLDEMANLKLNIFHWHLTDDQGWRIQIDKYPLLTEIGSKRDSTQIGGDSKSKEYKIEKHSGYYTKDDIREVIAYAQKLHITIVPEIEMPGHASAAIAAYPWLGTTTEGGHVQAKFGVFESIFNVADPRVITFFEDVIDEVVELFPGEVIHIGGDEARYNQWISSPEVTAFMKKEGIATHTDLQIWFTNKMSKYIESKGKRMMGWNEITGDKVHDHFGEHTSPQNTQLATNTIVHFWKGELDLVQKAAERGYSIVNSYHFFTYMDYNYRNLPLSKAYSFSPTPEGLPKQYNHLILGLGAQMWTEWTPTVDDVYRQVFPRLAAYAEVGWTQSENKSWERFANIMNHYYMPQLKKRCATKGITINYDSETMSPKKLED